MAKEQKLPPSASSLCESMRDIGYSLATAIADIVDNSITARATKVDIFVDIFEEVPSVVIVDNGIGMSSDGLILAMKHGSSSPKQVREKNDLGRFGLGLKTASFSQCRELTVVSHTASGLCGARWDLDLISEQDEWILSVLEDSEIDNLPYIDQIQEKGTNTGTVVIWRKLDRLFESHNRDKRRQIVDEKLDSVDRHLALVFHRFLSGEVKLYRKLSIYINGHSVEPFDPFCRENKATQVLEDERVRINGKEVLIQPYILPHHSKLSKKEYSYYENRSNFLVNQGAYIYRNSRLMAWGDWFRLIPKSEAVKLARVQIDFPNTIDESWTIDIKKSRARPPQEVKDRLGQIIEKITNRSVRVHKGRGQKIYQEGAVLVWERYADKEKVRFDLNRDHPLLTAFKGWCTNEQYRCLQIYLDLIEANLPVDMIYSDYTSKPKSMTQFMIDEDQVAQKLREIKHILFKDNMLDIQLFKNVVFSMSIFRGYEDLIESFIQEQFDGVK